MPQPLTFPSRKALKAWAGAVKRDPNLPPGTGKLVKRIVDNAQWSEDQKAWIVRVPG